MFRVMSKGLVLAASLMVLADQAWSVDPRVNSNTGRGSSIPSSNDPANRLINPGSTTILTSNQTRDRQGNITVPDPTRFEYNPTRPSITDTQRVTPQVSPLLVSPGTPQLQPTSPLPTNQPRWKLGVYSKDTSTGVQVVQVVNNGAAQRAGLEKDDVIISINGFQVGYVNGTLYDMGTEFERLADKNGWVSMLVFDNRNRSLTNLPVQLDSRMRRLGGTLTWRDTSSSLPARSTAVIEMRERARTNSPSTVVARTTVDQIRQNSIPFELEYDPAQIDNSRIYTLTAYIVTSNNQTLFQSSTNSNYQLTNLQQGQNRPVTIALERVANFDDPNSQNPQYGSNNGYISQEQLETVFQTILERNPSPRELQVWLDSIRSGASMEDIQTALLAHNQVFNQADRDERKYVERMHILLLDRQPTAEELNYWVGRYKAHQGLRSEVAREFLESIAQN